MPETHRRSSASSAAGARRESRRQTQNEGASGIVQINTGSLEVYLQGLKKQVIRHEEELQHPSWWDKIKNEVDKVPLIARKLDHSQVDIAAIRSFLTESSERLAGSGDPDVQELNNKVEFVKADVEGIRALVRRIELHQAVEVSALREVNTMQSALKDLQVAMTDDNSSDRLDALELDVSTLDQNLRSVIDTEVHEVKGVASKQQQQLTEVSEDISKMKEYIDREVVRVVENNEKIMKKLHNDEHHEGAGGGAAGGGNAIRKKAEQNRKLNELIEVAGEGRLSKMININFGVLKLGNALKSRRRWEVRICFNVWKKMHGTERGGGGGGGFRVGTPVRGTVAAPIIGRNGMQFVDHSVQEHQHAPAVKGLGDLILGVSSRCYSSYAKHSVYLGFQRWRQHLANRDKWAKLKTRFTPYLVYWHQKACPHLRRPFERWRVQTLMKRTALEIDHDTGKVKASWRPLEFQVIDPDNPSQQVNLMWSRLKKVTQRAPRDAADSVSASSVASAHWIMGNTMAAMARKSVHTDIVARGCAKDLKRTDEKLDRGLEDCNRKLNSRFDVADKALMNYKTSVTMKFNTAAEETEAFKAEVDARNKTNDTRFEAIELRLTNMEAHSVTVDAKLDRVLLLQGNILERIQVIEGRVQAVEDTNATRDVEVAQALKSSVAAMQDVAHAKAQTKDSLTFFDEELKYLKAYSRRVNDDLKQCMTLFTAQAGKSKAVSKELKKRLENVTGVLDMHVRGEPLPEELLSLYLAYEQRVVESQSMGRASGAFSVSIARELASFSHRLAEHVARTVDVDALCNLVCGPQALPATSAAGVVNGVGTGTTAGFVEERTPEESIFAMREDMLQRFNSEYLTLLNSKDSQSSMGSARAEARIIFHRRFVNAVETALSKHEVLVAEHNKSFFGVKGKKDKLRSSGGSQGQSSSQHQGPGEENCMACNRPLHVARFKGRESWQQTLLNSQPLAPSLTAVEANTHRFTTSEPPPRPRQVIEIPNTGSPHRHTAVYSTEAKIAMSHAQAEAVAKAQEAALSGATAGSGGAPRSPSPTATLSVMDLGDNNRLPEEAPASQSPRPQPVISTPEVAAAGLAGPDGDIDVSYITVEQQQQHSAGADSPTRTVVLQTKTDSINGGAVQPYTGNRPAANRRPVSASAGGASRHKGAIKDAYVMRGGFKMKIKNANQGPQGSESSSALLYSGHGMAGVLGGGSAPTLHRAGSMSNTSSQMAVIDSQQ